MAVTVGRVVQRTNASGATVANLTFRDGNSPTSPALNTGSNRVNPASSPTETLVFNFDNAFAIPKGTSKTIGLFGDLSSTATSTSFYQYILHNGGTAVDWTVKTVADANAVTESATDVAGGGVTIQTSGGYKVAAENVIPVNAEQWTYAGQKGVTMNILKWSATSEDLAITDLRLQLDVTGSSTRAEYEAVELWDGGLMVTRKIDPFDVNGITDITLNVCSDTGTTPTAGCFVIPKNGSKLMTIKADLAPIAVSQNGVGGELLGIDYDGGGAGNGKGKQKARGLQSGVSVESETHSDVTGTGVMAFRGIPKVRKCEEASGNCAALSGSAVNGEQPLIRFAVKAEGGDVKINRVTFIVSTSNITAMGTQLPAFKLYSFTNGNYMTNATGNAAIYFGGAGDYTKNYDSSGRVIVRAIVDNTSNYTAGQYKITAGAEHVFELRGIFTDDGTAGGSFTTTLLGEGGEVRPEVLALTGTSKLLQASVALIDAEQRCGGPNDATEAGEVAACGYAKKPGTAASSTAFIWSDISSEATSAGNTNTINTGDWMNGYKVPGLSSTGISHTKAY